MKHAIIYEGNNAQHRIVKVYHNYKDLENDNSPSDIQIDEDKRVYGEVATRITRMLVF